MRGTGARIALAILIAFSAAGGLVFALSDDHTNGGPGATAASTRSWQSLTGSPLQRTEVGAARVGRFVYVVGGFVPPTDTTDQVARYDIDADSWTLVAPMPIGLNHPAVTAYRGKLYVHGGYMGGGGLSGETNRLFRYDPGADSWTELASSGPRRAAHALRPISGKLYAAGGAGGGRVLRTLEIYDVARNRWTAGPGMKVAREHVGGAVAGGELYVLGGRAEGQNLRVVERYEPKSRRWKRVEPFRTPRSGFQAATVKGRILVAGGEQLAEGDETIRPVELFKPGARRWRGLPGMRTPRHGLGVVARGRRVFALEGGPSPGLAFANLVEFLDVPRKFSSR